MKNEKKGAALAEYVILLGLIGLVSISAVKGLGGEVVSVMDQTRDDLHAASEEVASANGSEGTETPGALAFSSFSYDYSDSEAALPPNVTGPEGAWVVDMEPTWSILGEPGTLRYSAWISMDGTFEKKKASNGDATNYLTINARADWLLAEGSGQSDFLVYGNDHAGTPGSYAHAQGEHIEGYVPSDAEGIVFDIGFSCSMMSNCEKGNMTFNIEFFTD